MNKRRRNRKGSAAAEPFLHYMLGRATLEARERLRIEDVRDAREKTPICKGHNGYPALRKIGDAGTHPKGIGKGWRDCRGRDVMEKSKELPGKVYLFFDEVQEVKHWERAINSFRTDLNCDLRLRPSALPR